MRIFSSKKENNSPNISTPHKQSNQVSKTYNNRQTTVSKTIFRQFVSYTVVVPTPKNRGVMYYACPLHIFGHFFSHFRYLLNFCPGCHSESGIFLGQNKLLWFFAPLMNAPGPE